MPSLNRAVAFAKGVDVAKTIAEDLHLDVLAPLDVSLEEKRWRSKVALGLGSSTDDLIG